MTDITPAEADLESLAGTTAIVTGASRGFGRAVSAVLCDAGAIVVGVARNPDDLKLARVELGDRFIPVEADATDPDLAARLIARYSPRTLVLNAGAVPGAATISGYGWDDFRRHWEVDVRHCFEWTRAALTAPLTPGSSVIAVSSGAALRGSPMSGGYAGSKATVRFISSYAGDESSRRGLGIRFVSVLPGMTPGTGVGEAGIAAYATLQGIGRDEFVARMGPVRDAKRVATVIAGLAAGGASDAPHAGGYPGDLEGAIVI